MALDPATIMGFCVGETDAVPRSGSVRLKRRDDDRDVAAFNALCFLRDQWVLDKPDLVCIEHFMSPAAQKSADAVLLQIMVYGVIVAMCQSYHVRYEAPHRSTVVKHFTGRANFGKRDETKRQVLNRAKLLKYIPADCKDDNRADAVGIWDWAKFTFARVRPAELVMFGERA